MDEMEDGVKIPFGQIYPTDFVFDFTIAADCADAMKLTHYEF